jgi:hypothetical protein
MTKKSFTVPRELFHRSGWDTLPPLRKAVMLSMYGECDDFGVLPVSEVGRQARLDSGIDWEYMNEILCELKNKGFITLYEVENKEFIQIHRYDEHLSALKLKRRKRDWPSTLSTTCRQPVDTMSTPRRQPVDKVETHVEQDADKDAHNAGHNHIYNNNILLLDNSNETKSNKSKARAKKKMSAYPDEKFNAFWKAYFEAAKSFGANAGAKKEAYDMWKKERAGDSYDEVMSGLEKWKASSDWENLRIRHAVRWLKARMWEDTPIPRNMKGNKEHFMPVDSGPLLTDDIPF